MSSPAPAPSGELGLKKFKMSDFTPFGIPLHLWNAFLLGQAHILGFYGCYLAFSGQTPNPWWNFFFCKQSQYSINFINKV